MDVMDSYFASSDVAAVIGHPISHSLSPLMHNQWLLDHFGVGKNKTYNKIDVVPENLETFLDVFKQSGLSGLNVTVPYKEAIIPYLDTLSPGAKAIGAVNTIVRKGDELTGFNTDGIGFLNHLRQSAPNWRSDLPVLLIGAGGAARGVLHALLSTEIPMVMVANRTFEKAEKLANDLGRGRAVALDWADISDGLSTAGLVINTTSLGMKGQPTLDISLDGVSPDAVIYDIVYNPLETKLLKDAREKGLDSVDGLGMLIHQGAAAFKLWFGEQPETGDEVRGRLLKALVKPPVKSRVKS